jgi:hypothetical protein
MQATVRILESEMLVILLVILLGAYYGWIGKRWRKVEQGKEKRAWNLHPRPPADCQDCRLALPEGLLKVNRSPDPWGMVKSRRGRPKEHNSDGYACMNRRCAYYRITDRHIHALRWDGQRNQCEATDQWECGACGSKHTARLGTPMYQLKTASERVGLATHLAMKGMSVADISEVMGHSPETIQRWLERDGAHSEKLHEHLFQGPVVVHIQVD